MKRRLMGTAAGLLAAVLFFPVTAAGASAQSAILLDEVGKTVLWEKNADKKSLIASTTKIMTGLLVCEQLNVLEQVRIPPEAVGIEGSSMYLRPGEVLTVQELLYGMMLSSGNDAAMALAITCSGSGEAFAQLMNRRAASLGMTGTHFENPHGLDGKDHRSTARDLGILGLEAMKNPIFRKTVSTKTVKAGQRYLRNHNKLLWQVPGAEGIKTGYTRAAGRILVSAASREGRRLLAVTISDPDDWKDHRFLLEKGFQGLTRKRLYTKGEPVGVLPLAGGERDQVTLTAAEDLDYPLREGERALLVLPGPGFAYAPAVKNAPAGTAWVMIGGTAAARLPLCYGETVEQSGSRDAMEEASCRKDYRKYCLPGGWPPGAGQSSSSPRDW